MSHFQLGAFPWEQDFDESVAKLQPDLSPNGWISELNETSDGS